MRDLQHYAWIHFAAASLSARQTSATAAKIADETLAAFNARFGCPKCKGTGIETSADGAHDCHACMGGGLKR